MRDYLQLIRKGLSIFVHRIKTQGLSTTFQWIHGRGIPYISGVPILKYSQVTPDLFVGPQFRQRGKVFLEGQGIHACVNMRIEKDDAELGLALQQYLHLPTIDDAAPSIEHLNQGVAFIRKVIDDGGKVYIHCGAGVGRAPTMAAAYLIAQGYDLQSALSIIRLPRPFITITPPQMKCLATYEEIIHQRST